MNTAIQRPVKSKTIECYKNTSFWNRLAHVLLLLPHLKPSSLEYIAPTLETVFNMLRLISTLAILALYIAYLVRGGKISGVITGIGLYQLTLFFSTWYNGGEYWAFLISAGSVIAMSVLVELMLRKDPMLCFNVMLPLLEILVYVNLLTVLLYPNGMYIVAHHIWQSPDCWFLGLDNGFIGTILPACMLALLRDNFKSGRSGLSFRTWLLLAAGYATIIIRWPATSVVGLMVLAVFILFPLLFRSGKLLHCRSYVLANIAFFAGIIVLRLQEYFAGFIELFLGKSLTFTGRTYLWDASMILIGQKPLLGTGVEPTPTVFNKIGQSSSHNQYLWDLYRGGILHFSCFVAIIVMVTAKLMQYRADRAAQILAIVVCIILLMWQVEAFNSMMFFAVYVFAYHIDKIIEGREAFLGKDEAAQQA